MNSLANSFPSPAAIFSTYASLSTTFTLFQQATYQFIPQQVRTYLCHLIERCIFKSPSSPLFTLVIEKCQENGRGSNPIFMACEIYFCTILREKFDRLKLVTSFEGSNLDFKLDAELAFTEEYEGVELNWRYRCPTVDDNKPDPNRQFFELTFLKEHKALVFDSYMPSLQSIVEKIYNERRVLDFWTVRSGEWNQVKLKHPFSFDKLALDPIEKKAITDDLDRFIKRREFYKRVGRAWKRGYLLYGPPGTGKSSLVAAMANYLRFDVYDLQLGTVADDAMLRELMLEIYNKSILVIEDIDCSLDLPNRPSITDDDEEEEEDGKKTKKKSTKISLSGLLNFIDGIWSSYGDERIIVFTTNNKDRLDPALLRPGRMDMHIHMSYLNMPALRILVSNYLLIENHPLFGDIERLIQEVKVTPAQVAEELMRSENVDIALQGVVSLLKGKKAEGLVYGNGTADLDATKKEQVLKNLELDELKDTTSVSNDHLKKRKPDTTTVRNDHLKKRKPYLSKLLCLW